MNIGNQIKKYREQLKISQEELADKIFVTRQTISNWENNKNYPDIKSLSLLSYNLNVSLDDLIKGDVEKMKEIIDEKEIKKLNFYSKILTICFADLSISFKKPKNLSIFIVQFVDKIIVLILGNNVNIFLTFFVILSICIKLSPPHNDQN